MSLLARPPRGSTVASPDVVQLLPSAPPAPREALSDHQSCSQHPVLKTPPHCLPRAPSGCCLCRVGSWQRRAARRALNGRLVFESLAVGGASGGACGHGNIGRGHAKGWKFTPAGPRQSRWPQTAPLAITRYCSTASSRCALLVLMSPCLCLYSTAFDSSWGRGERPTPA